MNDQASTHPLPALTSDPAAPMTVQVTARLVAGTWMWILPVTAPAGTRRGSRYTVTVDGTPAGAQVVFNIDGHAALRADPAHRDRTALLTLTAVRAPARPGIPADLATALAAAGADLDLLPAAEARQILLMIREAATAEIRDARIADAVATATAYGDSDV